MNHSELASHFNDVGHILDEKGHLALIRKTRDLIEGGDGKAAASFLEDAANKTNLSALTSLAADVRAWADGGGTTADLTGQTAWTRGRTTEARAANLIAGATAGGADALIDSLAAQTKAHAAGESLVEVEAPAATAAEPILASQETPADAPPPAADEPPAPPAPAAPAGPPTGAIPPAAPYDGANGFVPFAISVAVMVAGYFVFYSIFT